MRGLKRKRVLALILVATMILTLNRGVSAESLQDLTKGDATIESQVETQPSAETADPEKGDPAAVSDAPNVEAEPAEPAQQVLKPQPQFVRSRLTIRHQ